MKHWVLVAINMWLMRAQHYFNLHNSISRLIQQASIIETGWEGQFSSPRAPRFDKLINSLVDNASGFKIETTTKSTP